LLHLIREDSETSLCGLPRGPIVLPKFSLSSSKPSAQATSSGRSKLNTAGEEKDGPARGLPMAGREVCEFTT
jgi:hypothetical protein